MVYGHLACFQFATIKKKAIGFQNFRQRAVLPPPTLQPKAEEPTLDAHMSLAIQCCCLCHHSQHYHKAECWCNDRCSQVPGNLPFLACGVSGQYIMKGPVSILFTIKSLGFIILNQSNVPHILLFFDFFVSSSIHWICLCFTEFFYGYIGLEKCNFPSI